MHADLEQFMNDAPKQVDPVSDWMHALAAPEPTGALPDARVLWWQAQALRRLDQQRRLAALLEVGERVQLGCGTLAAVLLMLYWIHAGPHLPSSPFILLAVAGLALVAIAVGLAAWDARRSLDRTS